MNRRRKKLIVLPLVGGVVFQLAACGTIIYPERKGQIKGQLDVGVVALDAIGLLFFFVPGVIAFAVDFSNGTIYLPGGSASINPNQLKILSLDGDIDHQGIERIILQETGKKITLEDSEIYSRPEMTTMSSIEQEVRFL